jgi:hypothetical protein
MSPHSNHYTTDAVGFSVVSDRWQVSGFLWELWFSRIYCHNATELLLNVALNNNNPISSSLSDPMVPLTTDAVGFKSKIWTLLLFNALKGEFLFSG